MSNNYQNYFNNTPDQEHIKITSFGSNADTRVARIYMPNTHALVLADQGAKSGSMVVGQTTIEELPQVNRHSERRAVIDGEYVIELLDSLQKLASEVLAESLLKATTRIAYPFEREGGVGTQVCVQFHISGGLNIDKLDELNEMLFDIISRSQSATARSSVVVEFCRD
tara:strand:+ start:545 stop:1048 length:504 start_codon:yes stop_codon:yes gene_type:complete